MTISKRLFEKRRPHLEMDQAIAEFQYPSRADFTQNLQLGQDYAELIFDSYHVMALKTLGNGIDATLRQNEWFAVKTGNDERDEKSANAQALDFATRGLRAIIKDPRSGWQRAVKEADMDWVAFGNPVLSVEESVTRDHLTFRAWHPKNNAWMANENGSIDVNHRRFKMPARNIKRKRDSGAWKGEALHSDIELACKEDPTKEFECLHILMPTEELYGSDGESMRRIRHPYISIYIDLEHETYLNELGSPVFNYVIPRWLTLGVDPNGFSPAARDSLADGKMLQSIARTVLEQAEKAVDPPTVSDGDIFSRGLNLFAGGHTAIDLGERNIEDVFTTVESGKGVTLGIEVKQDVRNLIAQHMLLDRLFLPSMREMTATESSFRNDEYQRVALPFYSPIQDEYHSPLLGVAFEMAVNMGLIPAEIFPDELHGEDVTFTFNSPLTEAAGRKTVDAYFATVNIVAAGAQVDQTIGTIFDIRKATADAARAVPGSQPDWQLPEDTVKKNDEEAARVKQLAQGAEIARQGAGVVSDAANAAMAAQNAGMVPA